MRGVIRHHLFYVDHGSSRRAACGAQVSEHIGTTVLDDVTCGNCLRVHSSKPRSTMQVVKYEGTTKGAAYLRRKLRRVLAC